MALLPFLDRPFAIIDIETTGTSANGDRITEVAVLYDDGDELREWSTLLNPGVDIPYHITKLTGIDNAMVSDAPVFDDVAADLHNLINERVFIAHNAPFDFGFLAQAFERWGVILESPRLCTVRLSRKLFPEEYRHNLDYLSQRFSLKSDTRHRAMADAQLVWQLLLAMSDRQPIDYIAKQVQQQLKAGKR